MDESKHAKLNFKTYVLFGIGAFGSGILGSMANSFISFYYTDIIGVSTAVVSIMLVSARLLDAVDDPIIGALADRTNTRWGKYRPWMLVGSVIWAICVILLFNANPNWNPVFSVVWMVVIYCVVSIASGATAMSHAALMGFISDTSMQRAKLASSKQFFAVFGAMFSGLSFTTLVVLLGGSDRAAGYSKMSVIIACIALSVLLITCISSKERPMQQIGKEKSSTKLQLKSFIKNPLMIAVVCGFFMQGLIAYGKMGMMIYYFTYVGGNTNLMAIYSIFYFGTSMIGSLTAPSLLKLFKHKGKLSAANYFIASVFMLLYYFVPAPALPFWIFIVIAAFFNGMQGTIMFSMIADAADYGEWKFGTRNDGFYSAIASLGLKCGGAIMPSVCLLIITAVGYVPNAVQTAQVRTAMSMCISVIPATLSLIVGFVYLFFFRMSNEQHDKIKFEIEKKRAELYATTHEAFA